MRKAKEGEFRSKVYADRPPYADFDAPAKFEAIKSIIARRLKEHPNAMCSYSGGSDSDIMLHLIEQVREMFQLPPVKYYFFETGLEMAATRRHVKEQAEKYGVEIITVRPKKNIVQATREYGQPFVSKIMSAGLEAVQRKRIPLSIHEEYNEAENKAAKRAEFKARYPGSEQAISFLCCCNSAGEPRPNIQLVINSSKYMLDFIRENPIPFRVSNKCCDICKKQPAHEIEKQYDMVITGERRDEGGTKAACDQSRGATTRVCVSRKRQRANSACARCSTYQTRTKRGTRSTMVCGIPMPTRCTGSNVRGVAGARFPPGRRTTWKRSSRLSQTWLRLRGTSSGTATGTALGTTSTGQSGTRRRQKRGKPKRDR